MPVPVPVPVPECAPAPSSTGPRPAPPRAARARRPLLAQLALLALLALHAGCRRRLAPSLSAAARAPSASASGAAVATSDQAWVLAREGDPLELARLCDALGAPELGEVIGDAGALPDDRAAAIRALAFAEDPTPALDRVCLLAAGGSVEVSTLALQTLVQVAPRRSPIEEIEGGAWRRCGEAVLGLLDKTKDATRRALALRALSALAERGVVDPKRIPER